MPFPSEKAFNPIVTKTPILGPSSGNPKSFQDPNSVASIGNTIQAMADQAKADTLYDTPAAKVEAFCNMNEANNAVIGFLVMLGVTGVLLSYL
jgi:hypothetical protein